MKKRSIMRMAAALVVGAILIGCKGKDAEVKPVCGTLEEAFGLESATQEIQEAMASVALDDRYENTFEDEKEGVAVTGLDLDRVEQVRGAVPVLKQRRTDVYRLELQP